MTATERIEPTSTRHAVRVPVVDGERDLTSHGWHRARPPGAAEFQAVLSIRARVEEAQVPVFVRCALREISAYIAKHHVEVQGPPFSTCHPAPPHCVDVEVGYPVREAFGAGRITSGALPTALARRGRDHT